MIRMIRKLPEKNQTKREMASYGRNSSRSGRIIHLNVGGMLYTTSISTLAKCEESMLGHMFNGTHYSAEDDRGNIFIDRDGQLFRYVLNFLRTSELVLPRGFDEWDQLKQEADFYQIQPLIKAIQDILESQRIKKEEEEILELEKQGAAYFLDVIEHNQLKTSGKYMHIIGDIEVIKTLPLQLEEFNQLTDLQEQALLTDYHPHKSDNGYVWYLGKNQVEIQYINYLTRAEINATMLSHGCELLNTAVSYTNGTDTSNNDTMVLADKWRVGEKNLKKMKDSCWARRALPPGEIVGYLGWTPPN